MAHVSHIGLEPHVLKHVQFKVHGNNVVSTSEWGDFLALPVEILVFASPTGYMFTSSRFPLLNWGIFYKFL